MYIEGRVETVYLVGPINGETKYKGKFSKASDLFMKREYAVVNPAKMFWDTRVNIRYEVLAECFAMIAKVDSLALLPGWTGNRGSLAEFGIFQRTHAAEANVYLVADDYKSFQYHYLEYFAPVDYKIDLDAKPALETAKELFGYVLPVLNNVK